MASPGTDRSERLSGTGTNQTRSETEAAQGKAEGLRVGSSGHRARTLKCAYRSDENNSRTPYQ